MLEELPFDQYQRYAALRLAADDLRARLGRPLRILDVGDWDGLSARFCPGDLTVWLDPSGAGAGRYVQADGAALPFAAGAFDLAACLDTLEHVEPARRRPVVAELERVAEHALVLAVPIADDGAAAGEHELYDYVWDVLGGEQQQLREHAERGLPTRSEARGWLEPGRWTLAETGSGLLADWLTMMIAKHALRATADGEAADRALDRRYNRRHGAVDPAEPAYRQILFAGRGAGAATPPAVAARLPPPRRASEADDVAAAHAVLLAAHARRAGAELELLELVDPDPLALSRASRALDREIRSLVMRREAAQLALLEERRRSAALAERVAGFERGRFIRLMAFL
ncbi:MAG TPA: methyltransferase domain-containing protein, partial [Chloroflexota bacterium]